MSYFVLTLRFPYPKVAVAELNPPLHAGTSWNFDYIRPQLESFMNATYGKGKKVGEDFYSILFYFVEERAKIGS
jgi:hypothetical protein